jgi:hypothetical protein
MLSSGLNLGRSMLLPHTNEEYRCVRHVRRARPYEFIGTGAVDVTKTYKFTWFVDIHRPSTAPGIFEFGFVRLWGRFWVPNRGFSAGSFKVFRALLVQPRLLQGIDYPFVDAPRRLFQGAPGAEGISLDPTKNSWFSVRRRRGPSSYIFILCLYPFPMLRNRASGPEIGLPARISVGV